MADGGRGLFARPDAPHRVHDLLLVASFAAGEEADGDDRARAAALVEGCPECAALAADLRAIRSATASLPAPRRPRDFRLTPADAERLRPHGVRRLVAAVAPARLGRTQPLAAGLTMLGLAGLLVSSIPLATPAAPGAPAAHPPGELRTEGEAPAAASAQVLLEATDGRAPGPTDAPGKELSSSPQVRAAGGSPGRDDSGSPATPSERAVLTVGSATLVAAGVALFAASARQRRRGG